eukprot:COSAG06_NODE_1779_length_8414_cov_9.276248_6_plen_310_part_00
MSRTAAMMGGFGDLSDEDEILSPKPPPAAPTSSASPRTPLAGGGGSSGGGSSSDMGTNPAGLSRLERLERLAAQDSSSSSAPPPPPQPSQPEPEPEPEQQQQPALQEQGADAEAAAADELSVEFSGAGPLGLSFRGGRPGEGADVVVAQIAAAGAAAGRVQPGMVLRRVQGAAVAGMSHDDVVGTIRQAGRPLTLVFSPLAPRAGGLPPPPPPEEIKVTFGSEGPLGLMLDGALRIRQLAVDGLAGQNPALSVGLILCGIQARHKEAKNDSQFLSFAGSSLPTRLRAHGICIHTGCTLTYQDRLGTHTR